MPGNYVLRKTYVDGDILSASDYVADNQQHIDNQTPQATDDYSANVTQYRTTNDTGDVNSEILPTTLADELAALRYSIKNIKDVMSASTLAQWYSKSFSVVVADGTITTGKLADGAVTTAKLSNGAVTALKLGTDATYAQDLNTFASAVSFTQAGGETDIVSQAITLTNTRVRLHVSWFGTVSAALASLGNVVAKVYRDAVLLGTMTMTSVIVNSFASGRTPLTGSFPYSDNPGAGTFTYKLTLEITGIGNAGVVDAELMLEEIA